MLYLPRIQRVALFCFVFIFPVSAVMTAQTNRSSSANTKSQANTAPVVAIPGAATINGTVFDSLGDIIPGSEIILDDLTSKQTQSTLAADSGFFQFQNLKPGDTYHITVKASGFDNWQSDDLKPDTGQFVTLPDVKLKLAVSEQFITVHADTTQIATEQVDIAEHQRVLGIIPNFYVVYDAENAVPLTAKLKFKLAYRVSIDPATFVAMGLLAGVNQAADTPNFPQGMRGFGQRFGVSMTDEVTDIIIGGAFLPVLLHQDPRYFYQGTGSNASRARHAIFAPFICRGDNGKKQINFSSMGGDLLSTAISLAYYPKTNNPYNFVIVGFSISTAERIASTLTQEFILPRFTSRGKHKE